MFRLLIACGLALLACCAPAFAETAPVTAPVVDLRPLWSYGVELLVALAGVVGAWLISRLQAWLKLRLDDSTREYLDLALTRALQYAQEEMIKRGKDLAVIQVRNEAVALAASYAAQTVPDALKRFGVDGPGLEMRLRARLSEVAPHPSQLVLSGPPIV